MYKCQMSVKLWTEEHLYFLWQGAPFYLEKAFPLYKLFQTPVSHKCINLHSW